MPNSGPNPKNDNMLMANSEATSIAFVGGGPVLEESLVRCLLTRNSNIDGCFTHAPSSRTRNPAAYRLAFSISQSNPVCRLGSVSHRSIKLDSYVDVSTSWTLSLRFGIPLPDTFNLFGMCTYFFISFSNSAVVVVVSILFSSFSKPETFSE